MSKVILVTVFTACLSLVISRAEDYKVDYEGAGNIGSTSFPHPDKVIIVKTGPRNRISGFNPIWLLERRKPVLTLSDSQNIAKLVTVLGKISDADLTRGKETRFYVFHCLFYYEDSKTIMHFRVGQPIGSNHSSVAIVSPKSTTGSFTYNTEILPWLEDKISERNVQP